MKKSRPPGGEKKPGIKWDRKRPGDAFVGEKESCFLGKRGFDVLGKEELVPVVEFGGESPKISLEGCFFHLGEKSASLLGGGGRTGVDWRICYGFCRGDCFSHLEND